MSEKKFIFLGTNLACNNAFFVNEDEKNKLNINLPNTEKLENFTESYLRDSRSLTGNLNYISKDDRLKEIGNCEVVDVSKLQRHMNHCGGLLSGGHLGRENGPGDL